MKLNHPSSKRTLDHHHAFTTLNTSQRFAYTIQLKIPTTIITLLQIQNLPILDTSSPTLSPTGLQKIGTYNAYQSLVSVCHISFFYIFMVIFPPMDGNYLSLKWSIRITNTYSTHR